MTLPPFLGAQKDEDIRSVLKDVQPNATLLGLLNVKYVDAAFPIAQPDLTRTRTVRLDIRLRESAQPAACLSGVQDRCG